MSSNDTFDLLSRLQSQTFDTMISFQKELSKCSNMAASNTAKIAELTMARQDLIKQIKDNQKAIEDLRYKFKSAKIEGIIADTSTHKKDDTIKSVILRNLINKEVLTLVLVTGIVLVLILGFLDNRGSSLPIEGLKILKERNGLENNYIENNND